MRRAMMMAGVLAVVFVAGVAAAAGVPVREGRPCRMADGRPVLFTVVMGERAGRAVWRGVRRVGLRERRMLARIERCQRNPRASAFVRGFDARQARGHARRVARARAWRGVTIASWYDDAGATGCGFHAAYGVATFLVGCGQRITIRGPGGTVTAVRDDSGPYVAGRGIDMDPAVKAATGCSDLCQVRYR